MVVVDKQPGFDLNRFFQVFTFNLVSRLVGAAARLILIFAGVVLIFVSCLAGLAGFILWVVVPLSSVPVYLRYQKDPRVIVEKLARRVRSSVDPLRTLMESEAGIFLLDHLGIDYESLRKVIGDVKDFGSFTPESFGKAIEWIVSNSSLNVDLLRKNGLIKEDMITASKMWDRSKRLESFWGTEDFGRPSIGLEILFGYTPTLNQYSSDLASPLPFSKRLIGREELVLRMFRELSVGKSIVLTGDPGVGKKTVVLEFAHRAAGGKFGSKMSYKRVLEFDYNFILSESVDINKKKVLLSQILDEAAYAGNVILVIRDIHRLVDASVEGLDFTDVFEERLGGGSLKIIAISTNHEYERFIARNSRLKKFLERIEIVPPSKEQAFEILCDWAVVLEQNKSVVIVVPTLRKILDDSDRYITDTPFPEKALELLDAVVNYCEDIKKKVVTPDDVNTIFAEKTGISLAKLTTSEKKKLGDLENIIHRSLVDQDIAISQIASILRSKTLRVTESKRPIGSFLFLGPTGVGKTETAKVLARVYYGSEENILRFDMAEFAGSEGLERLVGSRQANSPGVLTTAIKNKPASLLLLDEFEKASRDITNLFLTLLDEGYINDAFGRKISAANLFVIATSNASAEYIRNLVEKGVRGESLQKEVINRVLEKGIFSPELINRFDGVVVYEPLDRQNLEKVTRLILERYILDLEKKGIILKFTDEVVGKLIADGYDPAFGARPIRRLVEIEVSDLIGKKMISGEISDGDSIIVDVDESGKYKLIKQNS